VFAPRDNTQYSLANSDTVLEVRQSPASRLVSLQWLGLLPSSLVFRT
jgi:hypothetical protein